MISNMAEPIKMKLSGMVEGGSQNVLAKEFVEKIENYKSCIFWPTLYIGSMMGMNKL